MDINSEIERAKMNNKLYLLIFFATWSPHYEWVGKTLSQDEPNIVISYIDIEKYKPIADFFDITTLPVFILKRGDTVLWKQIGEVLQEELIEIITMFN